MRARARGASWDTVRFYCAAGFFFSFVRAPRSNARVVLFRCLRSSGKSRGYISRAVERLAGGICRETDGRMYALGGFVVSVGRIYTLVETARVMAVFYIGIVTH